MEADIVIQLAPTTDPSRPLCVCTNITDGKINNPFYSSYKYPVRAYCRWLP